MCQALSYGTGAVMVVLHYCQQQHFFHIPITFLVTFRLNKNSKLQYSFMSSVTTAHVGDDL